MLRLYSGSGSSVVQLGDRIEGHPWERLRRDAIRYLRDAQESDAADEFENTPFELWSGTNDWNDEFEVLYLGTSTKTYLQYEKQVETKTDLRKYQVISETLAKLGRPIRFITVDVEYEEEIESVAHPVLKITSDVVDRALRDAHTLIQTGGAVSGLDRVHTAFHGYLIAVCKDANISMVPDASLTALFKLVRLHHPKLAVSSSAGEVQRVLGSMAALVDAFNTLRNRASVAHPNEHLLDEPEAMLCINSIRTLLHFLDAKLTV